MPRILPGCLALLLLALPAYGAAQTTPSQSGAAVTEPPAVSAITPGRGLTMGQVIARFGEPAERIQAIGEPPITRWSYDGYTVYFEYQIVLHSVVHR